MDLDNFIDNHVCGGFSQFRRQHSARFIAHVEDLARHAYLQHPKPHRSVGRIYGQLRSFNQYMARSRTI